MKEVLEQYRQERANLEMEIIEFLGKKFAEFKAKTGAEIIHMDVEIESTEGEFVISEVFIATDL